MDFPRYAALSAVLIIVLIVSPSLTEATPALPQHHISISFDLERHRIYGTVKASVPESVQAMRVGSELRLTTFAVNGTYLEPMVKNGSILLPPHPDATQVYLEYEGSFANKKREISTNTIGQEGAFLISQWYPGADAELARFSLEAKIPAGFRAVSEADNISVREFGQNRLVAFDFPYPAPQIHFVMAPYQVDTDHYKDIEITTYLLPEDQELAARYLQYSKKYLQMYEEMLGSYPFRRFAIVENILPTGYGMPTFTLLGRQVLKLPFIPETSLGHEILHSWLGNSVYVDYDGGNWSEGLTTYLADHHYEEVQGRGWEYRKKILEDYESYIHSDNEIPVRYFSGGEDRGQRMVGYGKTGMIFHMLKQRIGEDAFNEALRLLVREHLFQLTSWEDLQSVFSETAGEDLSGFFGFWLEAKGAMSLEVNRIRLHQSGQEYELKFHLRASNSPLPLAVPVVIDTGDKQKARILTLSSPEQNFSISSSSAPEQIIIDPGYDLFRHLQPEERRAVLSRLLGDPTRTVVLPETDQEVYTALLEELHHRGFGSMNAKEVTHSTLARTALLLLGSQTKFHSLFPSPVEAPSGFSVQIRENVFNPDHVVGLVLAENSGEVQDVAKKLHHYGKYSTLMFSQGKIGQKTIEDTERGSHFQVSGPTAGIDLETVLTLPEIISRLTHTTVVYVGEKHNRYGDHLMQLEVIQGLYQRNSKLAIGMEMFQRRHQKSLDDYISGKIDEQAFLKRSHYFSTWRFDYHLYRDILLYARSHRIPVIALNQDNELVSKVADQGLDGLSDEELARVPDKMDFGDESYKRRLRQVFDMHQTELPSGNGPRIFDFFHQAQILWDETMAESISSFLAVHSDHHMVVLAGNGHLVYGSGIPNRAYRRTKKNYAILLPNPEEPLGSGLADFVVFPAEVAQPEGAKLGVMLDPADDRLKVTGFAAEGGAEPAGMQEGDILVAMDDNKINNYDDLRAFLVTRHVGDKVRITVQRDQEMLELSVELRPLRKHGR